MQRIDTFLNLVRSDLFRDQRAILTVPASHILNTGGCVPIGFVRGSLDWVKYVQVLQYHVRTPELHASQI